MNKNLKRDNDNKNKEINIFFVVNLSLFGLLIFLSFWEARPRYIFNYSSFITIAAIDGFDNFRGNNFLRKIKKGEECNG